MLFNLVREINCERVIYGIQSNLASIGLFQSSWGEASILPLSRLRDWPESGTEMTSSKFMTFGPPSSRLNKTTVTSAYVIAPPPSFSSPKVQTSEAYCPQGQPSNVKAEAEKFQSRPFWHGLGRKVTDRRTDAHGHDDDIHAVGGGFQDGWRRWIPTDFQLSSSILDQHLSFIQWWL